MTLVGGREALPDDTRHAEWVRETRAVVQDVPLLKHSSQELEVKQQFQQWCCWCSSELPGAAPAQLLLSWQATELGIKSWNFPPRRSDLQLR